MPEDWYYFYKLHKIRRHELMGIANAMMNMDTCVHGAPRTTVDLSRMEKTSSSNSSRSACGATASSWAPAPGPTGPRSTPTPPSK
jgi:hypothetical protein